MTAADLLARVAACGYRVEVTRDGPKLYPARSECVMPAALLAELKANRAAIVALLTAEECEVCGRLVDDEDRERLAEVNPFCSQGFAKPVMDGNGVEQPESYPCPYRRRGT